MSVHWSETLGEERTYPVQTDPTRLPPTGMHEPDRRPSPSPSSAQGWIDRLGRYERWAVIGGGFVAVLAVTLALIVGGLR